MTSAELSADELAEIERKIARYRDMITKAAIRRAAKRTAKPTALIEKRHARALLDQPAIQIALLERVLAGTPYTELAAEYLHSSSFLSGHLDGVIHEQCEYTDGDHNCEWYRYLQASRHERHKVWYPLLLQRLKAAITA